VTGLLAGAIAAYAIAVPSLVQTTTATSTTTATTTQTITSTTTAVSTSTTTLVFNPYQALGSAYTAYLAGIESENYTAIAALYESNATLEFWVTSAIGAGPAVYNPDRYVGAAIVNEFYKGFFCKPPVSFSILRISGTRTTPSICRETEARPRSNPVST